MVNKNNNINWYPGHMKITRERIVESLKLVNLVVELVDARAPLSSKNPDIDNMVGSKPKILVLTKSDLVPEEEINKFLEFYKKNNIKAVAVDTVSQKGISDLLRILQDIKNQIYEKNKLKGFKKRPLRIMIVGIPNVGKSTLINKIMGKKTAKVGNTPGITKTNQWLKLKGDIEMLDTPGILWPKIEDKTSALKLSFLGSIRDEVLEIEDIYFEFIKYVLTSNENLKNQIYEKYNIKEEDLVLDGDLLNYDEISGKFQKISYEIGKKHGFIKNNEVDYYRLSNFVLNDFRNKKFGKVQLDEI